MTPTRTLPLLTAVTTLVTLELLRLAGTSGSVAGAVFALLAAAPAGPLVWWLGPRRALPAALGVLALARLVVQLPAARTVPVTALAAGVALAALLLTVRACAATSGNGPGRAARALALAVAADVALRLRLDLLDPVWHGGVAGWLWALLLAAPLAAGARELYRRPGEGAGGGGVELALLGPALALYAVLFASPAFVAAEAGWSVAAGLAIAAGSVLGVAALSLPLPPWAPPAALLTAAVAFTLLPDLAAPAAALALAALPAALRRLLAMPRLRTGRGALLDLALAAAGAALGYGLLVLAFHLRFLAGPLCVLAALGLAWAATRGAAPRRLGHAWTPVVLATLLLAVPQLANALRGGPAPLPEDTAGGMYRLLSWNVHHAVDGEGELAPEALLEVIRGSGAQVVVLQEVPRGWPGAGGLDLAHWLERRLDVTAVWAPAADRQFGNLILTSLPVVDSETVGLPRAGGDMDRSYASVTVRLTDGEEARIVGTHLDGGDSPDARQAQLEPLLRGTGDGRHTVLAGDLNARPGTGEIDAVEAAGLRSAQDEIGDPDRDTATSPPRRVDWIFGAAGIAFGDFRLLDSAASDHLPLAVTVYLD
ncbi:endonuclease/exonuclease/phosphatase family protein [Streptomyces litchfieldiae]|uniref:Endonuclease/exonuclease/phosphatase family protein n=1 Tax=Streptomyces litchfieldiae TaxID=3075543 RepID=A0ABU2MNH8_9ACTN|nr:endonuclease/exonuclease/phosphatase family protein [Streptomyces sp. DSM 44938]MDT0343166.1 endonuclease/exonuclease/phosphatase family protein [Streptomyces sp. DSM 44938]